MQSTSAPKLPPAKPFTSSSVFNKSATTTTTTTTATTTAPTLPHFFSHAWTPRTTSKPPHTRNPASTAAPTRSWRQHQQTFHPQPPPSSDNSTEPLVLTTVSLSPLTRCSSVVRAFAHGAMGRRIDPSWGGPIELFLVPASAPQLV